MVCSQSPVCTTVRRNLHFDLLVKFTVVYRSSYDLNRNSETLIQSLKVGYESEIRRSIYKAERQADILFSKVVLTQRAFSLQSRSMHAFSLQSRKTG
jgi:hypothetical protein